MRYFVIDNDYVIIYAIWLGKLITRDAWSAHVRRTATPQFSDHRGEFMTITISNLNVAANAPFGTTVGVLTAIDKAENTIPCNFILTKTASGYFAVSNNNLITNWKGSIAPGHYSVRVRAYGKNSEFTTAATFTITVTRVEPPPPPPKPTGVTFTSATTSLPDNSPAGTTVGVFSVSMSDGSKFAGSLAATPADTVAISANMRLVLARRLRAVDDGSHQELQQLKGEWAVSGSVQVQVTPAARTTAGSAARTATGTTARTATGTTARTATGTTVRTAAGTTTGTPNHAAQQPAALSFGRELWNHYPAVPNDLGCGLIGDHIALWALGHLPRFIGGNNAHYSVDARLGATRSADHRPEHASR
jgi:hypothetical protein